MRLTFNACTNADDITPAQSRAVARKLAEWLGDTVTVGPVFSDEAIFIVEHSHLSPIEPNSTYGEVMLGALDSDFLNAALEAGVVFAHLEIRADKELLWDSASDKARANA